MHNRQLLAGFRKAYMCAFVYSSFHIYCNKMRSILDVYISFASCA